MIRSTWKHFNIEEFTCKCGCNKKTMSETFISYLDEARGKAGVPFVINSGCRCYQHNLDEGGLDNSAHLFGLAADVKCDNSTQRFLIVKSLIDVGIDRIGIDKDFVHCDIDPLKPQPVIWVY